MSDDPRDARIAPPKTVAAGLPSIGKALQAGLREMGIVRTARTLLQVNQVDGFDCQSCAWPNPDGPRHVAEFCENGAKAVASEATTFHIGADFFADWSVSRLLGQPEHWLEQQGRLIAPVLLDVDDDHYRPVGWDTAFEIIASELRALDTADAAAFYTSGRTSNEAAFLYQLFVRQFGTNNLPDCSNMCHESSGTAMLEQIGVGKGTVTLTDFDQADLIIVIGQNPGTNHPRMLASLEAAKRRGARIIAINPLIEAGLVAFRNPNPQTSAGPLAWAAGLLGNGATLADLYLQIRINGDVAVLKGIMKAQFERESEGKPSGIDHDFIESRTEGFDAFVSDLEKTKWADIEAGAGVSCEVMHRAAEWVAQSRRIICCWAMGLTQHENAVDSIQEVIHLLLLGGHFGRAGAGACPVRGHSNVQGDRTMGIWEAPSAGFLDAIEREFQFAPPRKPGFDSVETVRAMRDGRVRVFIALGGNFVSAAPDTAETERALRSCRLTVQISTKLNRSHLVTGRRALILPCLGRSERDIQNGVEQFVTVEDSMSVVSRSRGVLEPASRDLRSEPWIVAGMADRVLGGASSVAWTQLGSDYDRIRDHIAKVVPGFDDFNRRIRGGPFTLPNATREGRFATANARARFIVHAIPQQPLEPGELLMMTIRTHDQFNTTVYGMDDRYRGVFGTRHVIFVNAEDIRDHGLSEGEIVDIVSRHGGVERRANAFRIVPYGIPRGCAAAYYPEANILVPLDQVARRSNTPASKSVRIRLLPHTRSD